MAINAADMESCDIKKRCLSGPNEGQAYPANKPCPTGWTFDELNCQCISPCYGGQSGNITLTAVADAYSIKGCSNITCYVNCTTDFWRVCRSVDVNYTFHRDNIDCLVIKYNGPGDLCEAEGNASPCNAGRFIYLYNCASPDGTGCGSIPITYVDGGDYCATCLLIDSVGVTFVPD